MGRFVIYSVIFAAFLSGCAATRQCTPEARSDLIHEDRELVVLREDLVARGARAKDHGMFDGNEVAHASEVKRYNIWVEQLKQDAERFNQQCTKARE